MLLLTIALLSWMIHFRLNLYHEDHYIKVQASMQGVATQITRLIEEKKRQVKLFVDEYIDIIQALATDPDNNDLRENLGAKLTQYFPDRFAFSIASKDGDPVFEDFDGLVSDMCLTDLKQFSSTNTYNPYIHPNTEGYHFDVMTPFSAYGQQGIFFVSFLADPIGPVLASAQSAGHNLILIYPERKDLIEIISQGARNHWVRDDYRLSKEEQSRLVNQLPVPGTRWSIVDLVDSAYTYQNYRNQLLLESGGILSIFLIVCVLAIVRLRREETQRVMAERQKEELMGVISHEFRTPTAVVKSALDLIMAGDAGEINADIRHFLEMASSSTSRLLLLVNDFLDIQKLESGHLSFNKSPTSITTLLKKVVDDNQIFATHVGAKYHLNTLDEDVTVDCDAQRIEQVLTNLLSNAVKYGGDKDSIIIDMTRSGHRLRITVTDHGDGIPESFQSRVFEKFAMASTGKQRKLQSTGLGLSISKAIIEQHQGEIGFHTTVGKGTQFYIELPL